MVHNTPWTIPHAFAHVMGIYSQANALTTPRFERFGFLMMACADYMRCYRKNNERLYSIAAGQVWGWYASLTEDLFRERGGSILAEAMSAKYPHDHCGYCGKMPCICKETSRQDHEGNLLSHSFAASWPISQWQRHLHRLYGEINIVAGVPRAFNRLFEEVGEVGLILQSADGFNDSLYDMQGKIAREMTDVFAWLLTTSSLLGVDVEAGIRRIYEPGCPICHGIPCSCRMFEKRPKDGRLSHRFMSAEDIEQALAA